MGMSWNNSKRTKLYTIVESETGKEKGIYVNKASADSRLAELNSYAIRRAFTTAINIRGPIRGQGRSQFNELVNRATKGFYHITTMTTND